MNKVSECCGASPVGESEEMGLCPYCKEHCEYVEEEEESICSSCNGSGEGMYDSSRCSSCKGSGEIYFTVTKKTLCQLQKNTSSLENCKRTIQALLSLFYGPLVILISGNMLQYHRKKLAPVIPYRTQLIYANNT